MTMFKYYLPAVQRGDSAPLLGSDETPPAELLPYLETPASEGCKAAGASPEEAVKML